MRPLSQIYIYILVTLAAALSQKDSDEGRPYEFGFTIDGQQHRHEKKDQLGIVQGEFGFITADGVYHTTVYATDENGNFKILSMRNIRISAPLDGSPATGPISPEAGKYLSNQKQPQPEPPKVPLVTQPPQIQTYPAVQGSQTPQATTSRPVSYAFTTQATIKPACGGCGYVTTQKPLSEQPFQFQNPAFKDSSRLVASNDGGYGSVPTNVGLGTSQGSNQGISTLTSGNVASQLQAGGVTNQQQVVTNLSPPQSGSGGNLPSAPQYFQNPQQVVSNLSPSSSTPQSGSGGNLPSGPQYFQNPQQVVSNLSPSSPTPQSGSGGGVPITQQYFQNPVENSQGVVNAPGLDLLPPGIREQGQDGFSGQGQQYNTQNNQYPQSAPIGLNQQGGNIAPNTGFSGVEPNTLLQPLVEAKLPPISVSGNTIHVGGKKPVDIPIKDKYPGMADGLPNGIEEKDIKDILYKFHYTVGFHGHYEKGLKNGAKIGGYFVNGRDGVSRVVTYVADENGYRPKFKFINLGLDSSDTPKEGTEKQFGLKSFEFIWYPIE